MAAWISPNSNSSAPSQYIAFLVELSNACHVSPSTLRLRNIKQLEDDLGVSLFERDRSVALTHEGQSYLSFAKEVLAVGDIPESLIAQADQLHGQLSIYCSVTASYNFLYDILTEFRVKHRHCDQATHRRPRAIHRAGTSGL